MKKNCHLFYCFHVAALSFMSTRPILGYFLPIFDGFSSKLPRIANWNTYITKEVRETLLEMHFCAVEFEKEN